MTFTIFSGNLKIPELTEKIDMNTRLRKRRALMAVMFVLTTTPILMATNISPGYDLFTTPSGSNTFVQFANNPIPADFFGPGSDPFYGRIELQGAPMNTVPPGILGPTDTVIRRLDAATLPSCGAGDEIPIEIVALNLVSVSPITVTFNGGQFNELWDVNGCLSGSAPQPTGTMTIHHDCDAGGTFTSQMFVLPNFTFTQVDDPQNQRIFDFGVEGLPPIELDNSNGYWTHSDPSFNIISSPGGVMIDRDCDGATETTIGPGSNFFAGVVGSPCYCGYEPYGYDLVITDYQNPYGWAGLGIMPSQGQTDVPTLSEWGMLIMGLFLLAFGTAMFVRRGKAAIGVGS